ncbi:MAG TPA: replication-relaxation family protein [Pyrinomonadaceae bacterium]|nr:replication-relaxation family protein [Pyrinomonadaceae bacterium]
MSNSKSNEEAVLLTERDVRIIQKLHAAGWLTTQQIRDYFFPDKSTNAVCKRLRKLVTGGYIAIARTSSTESGLYRVAGKGKITLIEHTLCTEEDISIPTQLPRKLKHFVAVNDLRLYFEEHLCGAEVTLLYFFSERELARYYEHPELLSESTIVYLKRYKIIPDALAKVRITSQGAVRELTLAIEYDAGTEQASFFGRTKIKKYAALCEQNYEHLGEFKVITFAESVRRLVSLMRQTMFYEPPRHLFYFASPEKLQRPQWAKADIFLEPWDFFVPVQRGNHIEVCERDLEPEDVPQHALVALPAISPRRVSTRRESDEYISHGYHSTYEPNDLPVI